MSLNNENERKTSQFFYWKDLHNHEVWAAVTCSVSSGLSSLHTPISDGITMDGKAPNSPKLKMIKFLAVVANT